MQVLANEGMTFLYTLLVSLGATFRELYEPIGQIWKQLLELGESMGLVSKEGSLAKDIANGLGAVLRLLFAPTRLVYEGFNLIARGLIEWVRQSEPAKAAVLVMIAPLRLLFDMLRDSPAFFDGFMAAAQASFAQVGKSWRAIMRGDFSGAAEEMAAIGGSAARAYMKAFDDTHTTNILLSGGGDSIDTKSKEKPGDKSDAGGDGTTQAERDKAAKEAQAAREKARKERQAEQNKADQERLDNLKELAKQEVGGAKFARRGCVARCSSRAITTNWPAATSNAPKSSNLPPTRSISSPAWKLTILSGWPPSWTSVT